MKKINETMTRKHNWDQLQIIQKKIDKQGGDISSKLGTDYKRQSKTANSYWLNNPLKRKIQLSDDQKNANTHTDPQLKDLPKNSLIKKFEAFAQEDEVHHREVKYGIFPEKDFDEKDILNPQEYKLYQKIKDEDFSGEYTLAVTGLENPTPSEVIDSIINMDDDVKKELIIESKSNKKSKKQDDPIRKEDRGNVNDIHRNMKKISNWQDYFNDGLGGTPNATKPRNIMAGKQVTYGDNKEGYIEDVQGDKVIIRTTDEKGHVVKNFKDVVKNYKIEKPKNISNISIQGPNQETQSKPVGDSKEKTKDLIEKGEESKDSKKLGKEIYKEKQIKIKKLNDFGKTTF